jgi:4-amino-4-deoxy-L-arabinose transferase-like glycosyltransferase
MSTAMDDTVRAKPGVETDAPGDSVTQWHRWALGGICLAAAVLYGWALGAEGWGNSFYASAVRSMSDSVPNFFFGAFDSQGIVTVDKPPLSLWPQVLSAAVFGYHGWALLLPQVIEGVAAVFLLHRTVRWWAGENVALAAAALFAITPITVAINRDNNTDPMLVLTLVASAYAVTRSVHAEAGRGRTRWLLWCAFFIGCGFITKMLEAWIIVPGVALAFWVGSTGPVKRRITDLLLAGVVLVVSSFWWLALHDLWWGSKPYVGGSTDGTALNLALGYNGFGRLFGEAEPAAPAIPGVPRGTLTAFGGDTGITRMFGAAVGTQVSWLLPLCLLILLVVAARGVARLRAKAAGDAHDQAGWVLWSTWLVVTALVFSFTQGLWHPYYTTMLAPAIAAIAAAGLALLWRLYRSPGRVAWTLLPVAIALTAAWAFILSTRAVSWNGWTRWVVLAAAAAAILGLLAGRLSEPARRAVATPAFVLAVVAMLLTPAVWSSATAAEHNPTGATPAAGPSANPFVAMMPKAPAGAPKPGAAHGRPANAPPPGFGGATLAGDDQKILTYSAAHSGSAEITLAIEGGGLNASRFIVNADKTVIGLGGFSGSDNAPSVDQLRQWVAEGKLKFILGDSVSAVFAAMSDLGGPAQDARVAWVKRNCALVAPNLYGGTGTSMLYSCA